MSHALIALKQERYARLLCHYLNQQGLSASVQALAEENEFVVSVAASEHAEAARQIALEFINNPNHPRYQSAAWQAEENVSIKPEYEFKPALLVDKIKRSPLTSIILILCLLVYGLSWLGLFQPLFHLLMMQPLGMLIQTNEWWRLLGPAFIHFSVMHIAFNLLWWGILGSKIESLMGKSMLLLVFVVSAVASNLAQTIVSGPNFGGLSGVVYALLGFCWWLGWLKPQWGIQLPKAVIGFMLVWLVLGYSDILWVNMANTAHSVGLISGCLLALFISLGADKFERNS